MNSSTETRLVDDGSQMVEFLKNYTVTCPNCGGAANVSISKKESFLLFAPRRLTCAACGTTKEWASQSLTYPDPELGIDWYFRLPFFFQKRCVGHSLWVANREHFEFLRSYVAAKHRTRKRDEHGWKNKSMPSRVPKWLSNARNRGAILSALDELEQKMKKHKKHPEPMAGHRPAFSAVQRGALHARPRGSHR